MVGWPSRRSRPRARIAATAASNSVRVIVATSTNGSSSIDAARDADASTASRRGLSELAEPGDERAKSSAGAGAGAVTLRDQVNVQLDHSVVSVWRWFSPSICWGKLSVTLPAASIRNPYVM